jgi:formylglycine-generating enzyme required for sulfatase activity
MGGSQLYGYYDIERLNGFNVRSGLDDHPCTDITWYGAIMACNWLTERGAGLGTLSKVYSGIDYDEWWDDQTVCDFNKKGFRLPTLAEWECAARWQGTDNSGDCYEYPAGSGQYWTRGGCASGASATTSNVNATAAVAVYEYDSDGYTNPDDNDVVKGDRQPNKLGLYDMSGNVWEWCFDVAGSYHRYIRGGSAQSKHHDVRIISTWDYSSDGTASDLGFRLVMSAD